jgi:hypothetical protein
MLIKRLITSNEFSQMLAYKNVANNRHEQQEIKNRLLEKVMEAYGDKYYRLKKETKYAIDTMCWLAADKGFVFAGADYLADRHEIHARTAHNTMKALRDLGVVVTVHRASTKHNGRGKPVHIFVDHPYFSYWDEFLKLDYKAHCISDCKAEKAETPCESKVEGEKNLSTYDLPNITYKKHINTYNKGKSFNFVSKEFKDLFQAVLSRFQVAHIGMMYAKIMLICKKQGIRFQDYKHFFQKCIQEFGQAYKQGKTTLENAGYFFGILKRKIEQEQLKSDYMLFLEEQERQENEPKYDRQLLLEMAEILGY